MEKKVDFVQAVPNDAKITNIVARALRNRRAVVDNAQEFGLDPEFIATRQPPFLVGPFILANPLSTAFAGSASNLQTSLQIGRKLVEGLESQGRIAQQALMVPLAYSEMPTKGPEMLDCLVVPKNSQGEVQRLVLPDKPKYGQPYQVALITEERLSAVIQSIIDSYNTYTEIYPQLKRDRMGQRLIRNPLLQDLQAAFQDFGNSTVPYLDFIANFNELMAKRISGETPPPTICVDTDYYQPFLRNGILDIAQFVRRLQGISFFDNNPTFMKIVDERIGVQTGTLEKVFSDDISIRFFYGDVMRYSDIVSKGIRITPCKDLSYLLCFGNFVPVIYGSQNAGDYYKPYTDAKRRLFDLGLSSTMYRAQPAIPEGYQSLKTVFDFYRQGAAI